jgi:hypothetical protein
MQRRLRSHVAIVNVLWRFAQWKLLSSRIQEPTRQKLVAEYLQVYVHGFPVLVFPRPNLCLAVIGTTQFAHRVLFGEDKGARAAGAL